MKVEVSVIIVAYNVEKFIEKCVCSFLKQTFKNIEIIVVNDGSNDSTREILENLAKQDNRIFLLNKQNEGLSYARKDGLLKAKGKYLIFFDGDDWIEPNAIEDMYNFAEKENLDYVITNFIKDDNKNQEIMIDYKNNQNIEYEVIDKENYIDKFLSFDGIFFAVWNKLYKKEIFYLNNIEFDKKIFLGEDFYLNAQLILKINKLGKINRSYVHYIQHSNQGSAGKKLSINILDLFYVYENIKKYYQIENGVKHLDKIRKLELNFFYINFLACDFNLKNQKYLEAERLFFKNLPNVIKYNEFKDIVLKNRIRLKILSIFPNKTILKLCSRTKKKK